MEIEGEDSLIQYSNILLTKIHVWEVDYYLEMFPGISDSSDLKKAVSTFCEHFPKDRLYFPILQFTNEEDIYNLVEFEIF